MPIAVVLSEPSSAQDIRQPVKLWVLILSVVLTVASAAIYVGIYLGGSEFEGLFRGFGTDLPTLTRMTLASYKYWGLFVVIGVVPCASLLWNRCRLIADANRHFMWVIAGCALSFFLLSLFATAMYLPIFRMGALVQ